LVRSVQNITADGDDKNLPKESGKVSMVPSIQYLAGPSIYNEDRKSNASHISNTSENLCSVQLGGRIEPMLDIVTPKKQQSMQQ
jgi:hypothetical protein